MSTDKKSIDHDPIFQAALTAYDAALKSWAEVIDGPKPTEEAKEFVLEEYHQARALLAYVIDNHIAAAAAPPASPERVTSYSLPGESFQDTINRMVKESVDAAVGAYMNRLDAVAAILDASDFDESLSEFQIEVSKKSEVTSEVGDATGGDEEEEDELDRLRGNLRMTVVNFGVECFIAGFKKA